MERGGEKVIEHSTDHVNANNGLCRCEPKNDTTADLQSKIGARRLIYNKNWKICTTADLQVVV